MSNYDQELRGIEAARAGLTAASAAAAEAAWRDARILRAAAWSVAAAYGHEWAGAAQRLIEASADPEWWTVGDGEHVQYVLATMWDPEVPCLADIAASGCNSIPGIRTPDIWLERDSEGVWAVYRHTTVTGRTSISVRELLESETSWLGAGTCCICVAIHRPGGPRAQGSVTRVVDPDDDTSAWRYMSTDAYPMEAEWFTRHAWAWADAWSALERATGCAVPEFPAPVKDEPELITA